MQCAPSHAGRVLMAGTVALTSLGLAACSTTSHTMVSAAGSGAEPEVSNFGGHTHGAGCGASCVHTRSREELVAATAGMTPPFQAEYLAGETSDPWVNPLGPLAACFDPNNPPPPEVVAQINRILYDTSARFNVGNRWTQTVNGSTGGLGTPVILTWSFVPDGLSISNGVGEGTAPSQLFSNLDARFGAQNRQTWINQFQAVFDRYTALTGITFQRVTFGGNEWDDGASWGSAGQANRRGDIRISMKPIDGANGILAYNFFPNNGNMVLDSGENWASGAAGGYRFFRNVIAHELGHGLGMEHLCNSQQLMNPGLITSFDGPQQAEVRAMSHYYGDIYEPNNTAAQATQLGNSELPGNVTFIEGNVTAPAISNAATLSLSTGFDSDWFRVNLATASLLSVSVTPVGSTYASASQSGSSCPTGNFIDALRQADIGVEFRTGASGLTLLAGNTTPGMGTTKTITNAAVPAGDVFVRVFSLDPFSQTSSQLYRMTVTVGSQLRLVASEGTFTDRVQLTWPAVPGVSEYMIYRNIVDSRPGAALIATVATTNYDDFNVTPGQVYYYWIEGSQNGGTARPIVQPDSGFADVPQCAADFNNDGLVNTGDITDFLSAWFGDRSVGTTNADFNGDNVTNTGDITDFLSAWFAARAGGC